MNFNVLLATKNTEWSKDLLKFLSLNGFSGEAVNNGKDAQLAIYQKKFHTCILDVTLESHSAFEVLRYIKTNKPKMGVLLFFPSKQIFKEMDFSKFDLRSLGINDVLLNPITHNSILQSIEGQCQYESWQSVKSSSKASVEKKIVESDTRFTRLALGEFHMRSSAIFDVFIRVKKDHYVKIFEKGDFFDSKRLESYKEKNVEFLYFKTADRAVFVNFMNNVIAKATKLNKISSEMKINLIKNTSDKIYESIETEGLQPKIVDECMDMCKTMSSSIEKDKNLSHLLKEFEGFDPKSYSHTFLVSFFSVLICKNLDWGTERTSQIVAFASLLHDIGKIKLNPQLISLRPEKMNSKQLQEYQSHPLYGAEILQNFKDITENVRQVVYQHHEQVDGSGFPNGLSGIRTYPLAKIVNVADRYCHIITDNQLAPLPALEYFAMDKEHLGLYDHEIVKALIKGFIIKK